MDLTIDSCCAACALAVGVASTVWMQELNRTHQEYIAANAEKIRELGFKTPTLKFQNGDVQNLKFSAVDKLRQPRVAACKVVAGLCYSPRIKVVPSSKMCVRSAGNESLNETEYTCSRVGSSDRIHRSGWRPWSSPAQTTGRFIRKKNYTF